MTACVCRAALVGLAVLVPACGSTASDAPKDAGLDAPHRDAPAITRDASHVTEGGSAAPSGPSGHPPQPQPSRGKASGLEAHGGRIVNGVGESVALYGVNRSGTEYACVQGFGIFDGPNDAASIAAMKSWGINAVRVPLNEDCWLAINGVAAAYSGSTYQAAIVAYVRLLLTSGMYPILDLHWTAPGTTLATGQQPMPDADHSAAFWSGVATTFKGDTDVVFELFNEPWPDSNQDTDAAWTCWQSGGTCPGVDYTAVGMQDLVTAVRATGATNLLLLGGVEYSNALTQWTAHVPTDPLGNLGAAWHVYDGNLCADAACWEGAPKTLAASYPIVATEIGDTECDAAFPTSVMTWLDGEHQSYLGWTWNTFGAACGNYSLITDYDGTPNGTYGMAFKTQFGGASP